MEYLQSHPLIPTPSPNSWSPNKWSISNCWGDDDDDDDVFSGAMISALFWKCGFARGGCAAVGVGRRATDLAFDEVATERGHGFGDQ